MREIDYGLDGIFFLEVFYSIICFYYVLLREEDGLGRGVGGDG